MPAGTVLVEMDCIWTVVPFLFGMKLFVDHSGSFM